VKRNRSFFKLQISQIYIHYLQDNFEGIIMCGSASKSKKCQMGDIDFVVVIKELSNENIKRIIIANNVLSKRFTERISPTIITSFEYKNIKKYFHTMDSKAVQAILDADYSDIFFTKKRELPNFTQHEINTFSEITFYIIQNLLRKLIIRSNYKISNIEKVKIAKCGLILNKIYDQHSSCTQNTNENYQILNKIKCFPENYSLNEVININIPFLKLNLK
jgi:hypothetical protein